MSMKVKYQFLEKLVRAMKTTKLSSIISLLTLIVTTLSLIGMFTVPNVREFFGLDEKEIIPQHTQEPFVEPQKKAEFDIEDAENELNEKKVTPVEQIKLVTKQIDEAPKRFQRLDEIKEQADSMRHQHTQKTFADPETQVDLVDIEDAKKKCDKLASFSDEKGQLSEPVHWDDLNPVVACPPCRIASEHSLNDGHYIALYARSLHKKGSIKKAAELYQKAADLGNVPAMTNLSVLYYEGKEYEKAKLLFIKAADSENGSCRAAKYLWHMFNNGIGVRKNSYIAKQWQERFQELKNGTFTR